MGELVLRDISVVLAFERQTHDGIGYCPSIEKKNMFHLQQKKHKNRL
jgi:hypothetical protein